MVTNTLPKASALPPLYIVGGGALALKLAAVLEQFQLSFCFIDEFSHSPLANKPVFKAEQLPGAKGVFLIAISFPEYAKAAVARLVNRGVTESQCLHFPFDSTALVFGEMLKLSVEKTLKLLCEPLSTFVNFEQAFFADEWQDFTRASVAKPRITFCRLGIGSGYLGHLGSLPDALAKKFECILLTDQLDTSLPSIPSMLMSQAAMLEQDSVDLQITAHVYPCSAKKVKQLSFVHMVYDFLLFSQQTYEHLSQPDTHYVFIPSQASLELHKAIYREKALTNNLILIPGGYPKHDQNLIQYQQIARDIAQMDAVLYAPTLCTSLAANETEDCYSILQAVDFIPALVEMFPNINIIFRPHPEDLALAHLVRSHPRAVAFQQVLHFCQTHPRCVVDTDKQSYLESFAKSKLVISDTSSVAFSFVLLTNRPAIFYADDHARLASHFNNCQFIKDRTQFGVCVSSVEALLSHVATAFSSDQQQLYNAQFCRQVLFNLGSSERYLLENFDYILNDKRHPDWVYLQDEREHKIS